MKYKKLIFLFVIINLVLNIYGNNWGLPSRWHSDEKLSNVLHMMDRRSLSDDFGEYIHPTGYHILLIIWLIPFFLVLKFFNFPLVAFKEAASVSWFHMANLFPDFATSIYIYARLLSALLGALTVYLIFLLGKKVYGEKEGFLSAVFLSFCMGFVGLNHFAKHGPAVNIFIVLVLLLLIEKKLYFALFFAGVASSIHFNGGILLVPIMLSQFILYKELKLNIVHFVKLLSLYIFGMVLGTPSLLTNFNLYFMRFKEMFMSIFSIKSVNYIAIGGKSVSLIASFINFLFEAVNINGALFSLLILIGMILIVYNWRKISSEEIIIYSFIFSYLFIMVVLGRMAVPEQKYIIGIIPLIIMFAGVAMARFLNIKKIAYFIRYGTLTSICIYSFCYTVSGDIVFAKGDTRYASTQWVYSNVPKGSKIEVFDQLHYVLEDSVMNEYEIIYLGRSSKKFKGKRFFKWDTVRGRGKYLSQINKSDSISDCIIVDVDLQKKLSEVIFVPADYSHIPGLGQYLNDLFGGRKNYHLVKIFEPARQYTLSERIKGVFFPNSLWWDPMPVSKEMSPIIYVFKRNKT